MRVARGCVEWLVTALILIKRLIEGRLGINSGLYA